MYSDFSSYNSLVINTAILGDINTKETKSNPFLEYLKADVMLFPKENFQQSILDQSVTTNPEYESFSVTDDTMLLKWYSIQDKKISFKIDTDIEVKNDFPKIKKAAHFPIRGLDINTEKYVYETAHIDLTPEIRDKANEIAAGETDLFVMVYKVGEWVKGNIKYDLNTLTAEADQKASWVFANKKGVCDEITNLFIAMLRSVNVPARFVSGIVYSNVDNDFGNHGWAEVYFLGYGWVPFDVTFGQYGWIDPTHVKLDDSYDSGVPSVEYHWASRGLEVEAESLEFKTEIKQKKGRIPSYVSMEIKPLKERVRFGSYMPIEVTVKNLHDYYLPLSMFFTKAPELAEKNNARSFLLKPLEQKRLYWTVKIPSDLEEEYIYTSELEVTTNFGATASNVVKYAKTFEQYSEEWAEEQVETLSEREKKFFFSNIDLKCKPDKESYYSIEDANIKCSVLNTGNVQLDDVSICLAEDCQKISLNIGEKKDVSFTKSLVKSETVTVTAENKDMIRYSDIKLEVIEIPDLEIESVKPESIGYDETDMLIVSLVTESPAYNVKLDIKGLGIAEWEKISDKNFLKIPFEGSTFPEGHVKIIMSYNDALNKTYTKEKNVYVTVTGVPSSVRVWHWLKNLF